MELQLRIGKFETTLVPVVTNAPVRYDGFGTFTLRNYDYINAMQVDGGRLVMVRKEHLEWQTMRYRSGGFGTDTTPEEDNSAIEESYLTEQIYEKLTGPRE